MDIDANGNNAPELKDGIAFRTWIGLQSRLQTERGQDIMNPDYGIDIIPSLDIAHIEFAGNRAIDQALEGLPDINGNIAEIQPLIGKIIIEVLNGYS